MLAEAILRQRQARNRVFGRLPETAWTMLLDLWVAAQKRQVSNITSLCVASLSPGTTALRHISDLVDRGLVSRWPNPTDARMIMVSLTDEAREQLAEFERQCGDQPNVGTPRPRLIDGVWQAPAGYAFVFTAERVRMGPFAEGGPIMVPVAEIESRMAHA